MSTTTDDEAALLAAICEQPDEDTVRLAYADWLTENGQIKRAEFIRLEVELAAKFGTLGDVKYTSIQNRLRELHEPGFLRNLPGPFWLGGDRFGWSVDGKYFTCQSRRGFIHSVTCTTANWLKHADALVWQCLRCPSCDGAGWRRWQTYSGYDEEPCDRCEETGLIRESFPLTAQPITKVTLTTRSNWMHRDGKIYLHDGNFEVGVHRLCRNSEIRPEVTDLERLAESRDYLATLFHDEWPGIEIEGITT